MDSLYFITYLIDVTIHVDASLSSFDNSSPFTPVTNGVLIDEYTLSVSFIEVKVFQANGIIIRELLNIFKMILKYLKLTFR